MLAATAVCVPVFASVPGLLPVGIAGTVGLAVALFRQLLIARENRLLMSVIADQALRDPLTGLANRELFSDRLASALRLQERQQLPVTVIVLDLDNFKPVNDLFGHHIGDALLVDVSERLRTCVRDDDDVARLGGDEFAILIDGGLDRAEAVAHQVAAAFGEPFEVDGHVLESRPSVGLAVGSPDEPTTAEELLKRADLAMYAAKRRQAHAREFDQ